MREYYRRNLPLYRRETIGFALFLGWVFCTLFGCGLVTYLTRMPTLVFAGKWKIPEKARRFMSYIGPSILTALIVPSVFLTDAGFDPNPLTNLYILPAAVVIAVSFFWKKPLPAILAGIASAFLLSLVL